MNREDFVQRYEATWRRTELILKRLEVGRRFEHELAELPRLYRRCCQHLALARQRQFDGFLEARLHDLVLRGYHQLYRRRQRPSVFSIVRFLAADFPRRVRAEARLFWLATALFYLPGVAMSTLVLSDPGAIHSLLDGSQLDRFEEMYRAAPQEERGSGADFEMFGAYVANNVGIAFRTFAGGIFCGVGSIFFLVFNGLYLGAVFSHLVNVGGADNLLAFVVTHGSLELTALVIAGAAGLRLGVAILAPGQLERIEALRRAGRCAGELVTGAAAMLLLAAFVEAFWSSVAWASNPVKVAVGSVAWILVGGYLALGGRR